MCTISSELLVAWADRCWINWSSKVQRRYSRLFFHKMHMRLDCLVFFFCVKWLFDLSHLPENKNWQQTNGNGGQINNGSEPASVAQLDARPTGDQEVAGSTPAEVGNILSWRLIMKYFLRSFSPFRWFKKGSCQFLAKECAQYWLIAWRTKPAQ